MKFGPSTITWVVFMTLLAFAGCENSISEVQRMVDDKETMVEKAKDVEILYSDSAEVKVRIRAKTMLDHADPKERKREFPDGVLVEFFNSSKSVTTMLSAKYAIHIEKDKQIILRDSVIVWNANNDKLTTEELIWDEKTQQIRSDKFVRVRSAKEEIYGRNFVSNHDFTKWEIKEVEGFVEVENLLDGPLPD